MFPQSDINLKIFLPDEWMGCMSTSILLYGKNDFRKSHMVQIFRFIKLGKLSKTLGSSPRWDDESLPNISFIFPFG